MRNTLILYTLALVASYTAAWVGFGYMLEHAPSDVYQINQNVGE